MYYNRAVLAILVVFWSLMFTHGFVCGPELVCDAGWTMSKTAPVCYLPVNVSMNWEFASLACESVGASLIKIEDETENCEIRNYFEKFWIGLSRSAQNVSETVWNGKEVVSDREGIWDVNQPDTDDNKLKCVAANKNHLGRWSYENCLTKMPFVCKKKSKLKGCFQCPNGDVIPPRQLCDDENDCGDNSDEIDCSSKCRYLYYGSSGDITYNLYEDKKTCQWKIVGPIGSTIKLMVKKGTSFEMNADFITIPQTLTNGLTGPITEDRIYYSRNNILRITLNSDNSQTGPFVASWLAENVVENWKLTATTAVKKLTLNSLPYKQYEWIITAENKNVITLQFESVTLDKSSGSFLKFFDGDQPVSVNYNPGEIYVSRSKSMRIVLVSYSASNQLSVSYNQGCTITASSQQTFNIASPGFQEDNNYKYPNDVHCEWKISALSNYPASIKFSEFDLKLNSDYLAIKNRTADLYRGSGFSGDGVKIKETVFRSTDGYFMLGFTSDMAMTAKGFQAQYSIDCKLASPLSQWTETEPKLEEYTPFDTEITVTCMTGYQFKQEEYNSYSSVGVKCMKGGSWNVTKFPDCEISHCGTPPAIDYGYILSSTGVTYNNTATYKCDEGFTIDKSTIKCLADGKWETKPKCTASGCTARTLTPYLNYTIIDGGFEKYGNVLQFFCEPGYQIIGSLRIYCKTNGWSHDSPMCKEITCPIPTVTEGSVKSDSGILFGKIAILECNSGYNVNGTNSNTQQLTCGTDGTFNNPQGEKSKLLCTDIDECEKESSLNTCKANQMCVNNLGGFSCPCKEGYKPDPDPNKDCYNDTCRMERETGNWFGTNGDEYLIMIVSSIEACEKLCIDSTQCISVAFTITNCVLYRANTVAVAYSTASTLSRKVCPYTMYIDECEKGSGLNTCKANQMCVNHLRGFTCPCKEGYKPDPNPNKDCINIDECQENNGGCGHTCKDETPGYSCTCKTGYELYMYDGFNNISLAEGEDGKSEGDVYYINHTCVRKQCPKPVSPKDGVVLSQKQLFYFEDTVEYKCNHGYKMNTSSPLRTCGSDGKWNSEPPGCEVATCKTQSKLSDVNINRVIPGDGVEINYGEESIIECNYGTKFINRTQYCGYNGSDTYDLLGDTLGCPVIDCGQPMVKPGSSYTMPTKTTYAESFAFSCQTGFKEEGISTQGTMKVKCEENGRWGMGNLTCTGDMCADPGTAGGAYQVVTSYEVGELLYFQCKRNGYQPVPPEPLLCQIESGNVKWNNTQLPACKDVTDPVFSNCPSNIIYVDNMEQVSYTVPTATDNSGVVKNTSVSPAYMKPNTVIEQDTEIIYYAEDYAGNRAMCSIQIKIKNYIKQQVLTLQCVSEPVAVKIQNNSFINSVIPQESLVNFVSNSSNLTIPSLIPFNSLSNPPKEIKITAMDTYGTTTSCSVLSFPLASACFEEGFPTTPSSQRICTPGTNDSLACNVTCDTGYIFYDGKQSQTYQCEMAESPQPYQMVTWAPRSSPNYCLRYFDPAYRVEIEVSYSVSGALAYKCIADHDTKLKSKEFRDALATQLKDKCSTILTVNNDIQVEDTVITTTVGLTMTSKLVSAIPSGNPPYQITFCTDTINFQLQSGLLRSYLGYNSPVHCSENTASASVTSAKVSTRGKLCSSGTIEKTTDLGTKCVSCPPGSYFTNDSCVDCPDGQYQDVAGQLQCKICGARKSPSGDQTTCIDFCPKGFINDTIGQVPFCVPCPEDTYWLNSTYCQTCPTGYKTFSTAAKGESDCKEQHLTLECVSGPVAVKIQNNSFVNSLIPQESLVSFISNPSTLTIPSLKPFKSLSDPPMEIKITAMDTYGTTTSCSVLSLPLASACFEEGFPTTLFSQRICTPGTNDSLTCNVTCDTGYIFYDGKQSQTYQCEMAESPQPYQMVTWRPRSSPNYCLRYSEPIYRVEIEVTYTISGALAYNCVADHETKLKSKEFRDALATQLKNLCSFLTVNNDIQVEETFITMTAGFTMTSKLVSVIPSGNPPFQFFFCSDTINFQLQSGTFNSYLGYNSSLNCTENTASASVSSTRVSNRGNLCSPGTIEKTTDLGIKCVSCPPGSYYTNDSCVACPDGQYQDTAGQFQCKMCDAGKSPSGDQTTCIDLCPKGFINDTIGQVPFCVPCPEDTYWLNSTYCQACLTGYKTFSTAVKSESGCKAPCGIGNYSTTGYEPCTPCPVNYYQDKPGQKTCAACKTNEITEHTGTSSSSFCIDQTPVLCNASRTQCSGNGDCSVIGHMKYCACNDGYKGDNCENENNPCGADPCFNGGNCIKTGVDTYNCSCLIRDTCRMVRETGNWVGTNGDEYNMMTATSIEACEKACIDNTQCKSVAYAGNNCVLYRVNTVAVAYPTASTLSRKVCDLTVLFTGDQCETDAEDSCTNNTECGNYGMCQDGLGTVVDGQINPISSFKCLCQKEGEFEEGNRCKKKQDFCSPNPCENNGKCVQFGEIRRHCECLPGYTGENCSTNIDECKIHPNGCLYNGECKDGVNSYTCTCKTGFGGDNCQTAANLCTLDPRCRNGLCYNNYDNYTAVCVCEKPYQLATKGKCVLMDPCLGVTCQNGTCKDGKCECQTGYEGSQCQHDIDDCKNEPCKNGAQCIDKYNSFECKCKSGYEGTLCDQNVDDCVGSCENSKTISCQDKVADFECICMKGYTGKNCSKEINKCDSYPCKHESECIDQVGDYKCNCSAGWTGKDCGTPVDYCKNNPCQNGGNCHNLIDGYFCRCKPGTRGDNCDIFPKVCSVTVPCTSNGACWDTDGTAKCNCTDNYTGVSCNLIKDRCEEKVCMNGGTCQTKDLGFQCLCPGGYSGPTCEVYTDPCSGSSKCHSTAMCKSEYDKYLCLCAQGKTLTGSGCKATFEDWDMFFDSKIGSHGALSLTPFMLGTSEFTVAFWTRFKVNDDQPEPVLIRMSVSSIVKPLYYPIDMEDLSKLTIFKVTNDSVYTSNGTEETTVKLKDYISDGKWHHVGVKWKSSGELEILVDGVRQISTGVQSTTLPKYIQLLIGQNFNGRLSRVTVWQTALSFVDIVKASADPNYKPTGTIAQGWTNYMLSEGSERRYPSKVKQTVCDLGLEDATCNNKYKEKPGLVKCPSDKTTFSSTRLTKIDDLLLGTDIVFSSKYSLKVHENFPSDRYFGYGAKSYYGFAIDDYGNSVECIVRVVVKRSSSCTTNNGDYKLPFFCDGESSGSICDLQCNDNTLLLSQPVPKIFKCGNLGTYYTESVCKNKLYNQGVKDFVLPSCGGRGAMKRRIEVKLQYRFQVSCTSSFLLSLKNDIGTTFNSQISDWSGICPIVSSVCSTVSVTATCSTTQNVIADVLIKVSDLSDAVSKGGAKYSPIEALRVLVFIERKFSYPNIGASVVVNETVLIEEFKSCGPGYAIVGQNCVQCPAGSYYDSSTYSCKFCDIGNYQNLAGQSSCISCGGTKTTLKMGSSKTSDCVEKCLPGTYYETGNSKCEQCPIHHYQDEEGKTYCLGCPIGTETSGSGSNSSSDCYGDCIAGTELKLDGSCQSCPRGYYRSVQEDKCEKCKNSNFTTKSYGTKSEDFCNIRICYAGTYRNASINECQDCPVGEYQPEDLQDSCKSCDPSYSTKDKGSVNETSCIFYCNPGEEVESVSAKICRKCDRGKYKDNNGNNKFDMCMPCPEGNTTVGFGSTSLSDCIRWLNI